MSLTVFAAAFAAAPHISLAAGNGGGGGAGGGSGVITIDQAKAEAGNVTDGDTAGFPVTISQPGSYQLTGNLTVADPNTHAIVITTDNVTLDLNGFAIVGPVVCSYPGVTTCTPGAGTGDGIYAPGSNTWGNVAISNGTVRGMGRHGIDIAGNKPGVLIDRVRTFGNRSAGMVLSVGVISNSVSVANGSHGITGNALNVQSSYLGSNGGYGLFANVLTGYGSNVLTGNTLGNVNLGPKPIGANLCGEFVCQ